MNLFRYRPAKRAGRFLTFVAAGSLFLSVASVSAYAQTAPPNISGLSTTVVQSGSTLTIYGSNFDWSVAAPDVNDSVMLGSVELPVESWSTTSITVMVPIDAASGQLTVNADNGTSNAVTLAVAARGILELNQTGQVAALDGAGLFDGPAPGKSYAVAIQSTPDGSGYWILDKNGTVDSYGDATKMAPSAKAPTPAVGLAINPSGTAGWVLSQDGIVTNLAETNQTVAQTVYSLPVGTYVAMAADPLHSGYYALNKGGTVIGEGSVAGTWHSSVSDPVALAADPNGGFWVLGQNGSVDAVDGAQSFGGLQTTVDLTKQTAVAIASTPDGNGYYIATNTGKIYAFGDAVLPTDIPASQTSTPTTALAIVGPYQHYSVEDLAYWYPPGNLSQYVSFQNSMGQADNIISPHWYGVNANGTVSGPGSSIVTQVAEMQANGLQVVPMFGRTFNSTLGPLATVSGQDQLVSNIMAEVNQYHLNGANIDFEALPDNSEGYLDAFVQKLRAALGPSRLLVTNVYPDWTSYTNQEGQTVPGYSDSVYNYTELSQLSNYMVVMAYSLSFNPGPIASLTHDTGVIDYLLHGPSGTGSSGVDLNHVLLGIPGYGQVWEGTTGYGMGNSMTVPQITSMLAKLHVTPTFDPHAGEDFAHYRIPFTAPQATIANGDTGTDVVALQYGLSQVLAHPKAFGADNTNGTPPALPLAFDGIFGNDTEAAVSAFQTDFDISGDPSGVYGPATRAKLASLASQYASKFSPGVPATVWFDNAEADLVHAQLAQSSGLAGVSLWAMGEADPAYFSTLASGTDVTANPDLAVTLSAPTLYAGTTNQETVTVAQGTGFPIANLTVTLLGHTATTNGSGQASFTVDPASVGSDSIAVTDPSGQAVANTTVSVAAPTIARLAGATRYQTAIQLANSALSEAHTVILTTATNYPDALSGAPLAKALGAPILLTDPTTLTAATAKELANLGAKNVVLLGGPAAIAPAVSTTLQQEGYTVTRYAGASRFGTAAEIAMALGDPSRIAVIANGDSFQNALAVAPIAASQGWPLLLANGQNQTAPLTHSSIEALEKLGVTSVYIIGDTTEIPASISGQLTQLHIQSVRIQGQASAGPVYGTNLAVLEYFASKISLSHLYLATGTDFPDALTAAPVAAESDSAVLLIPGTGPLESQETAWLSSQTGHVGVADIVGGVDAITPTNADQVASDLGIKPT